MNLNAIVLLNLQLVGFKYVHLLYESSKVILYSSHEKLGIHNECSHSPPFMKLFIKSVILLKHFEAINCTHIHVDGAFRHKKQQQ